MTGEEIRFKKNNEEYVFKYGEKRELKGNTLKNLYKNEMKKLKPIFDEIVSLDNKKNKLDSENELELLKKLHLLIASDGEISDADLALGDEFKKLKKENKELSIESFLNQKLDAANIKYQEENTQPVQTALTQTQTPVEEEVVQQPVQPQTPVTETQPEESTSVPKRQSSDKAYNQAIQTIVTSIRKNEETLKAEFTVTHEIKSGENLTKIAIQALKDENDGKTPTLKEINQRLAEIALVNGIKDVNTIHSGKTIYVGKGTSTQEQSKAGEKQPVQEQSKAGEKQPVQEQSKAGEKQPVQEQPKVGEKQPVQEQPKVGEKQPVQEQPKVGEKHPVGELNTKEDVVKYLTDKNLDLGTIPFDDIMSKFGDDPEIKKLLLSNLYNDSNITDENRIKLLQDYMKEDGTFDKAKFEEVRGSTATPHDHLPEAENCKEGKAKQIADAMFKSLGKDNIVTLLWELKLFQYDAAGTRLEEIFKENASDTEFIKNFLSEEYFSNAVALFAKYVKTSNVPKDKVPEIKEQIYDSFEKQKDGTIELSSDMHDALQRKGWIIQYDHEMGDLRTIGWCTELQGQEYRIVDVDFDRTQLIPCNFDGIKKGLELFVAVYDFEYREHDIDESKLLNTENYITKDNVIDMIEEFNRQSVRKNKTEKILEWLDNEWGGASKEQMNKFPEALIERAKEVGISDEDETIKKIKSEMVKNAGLGGDYASGVAKELDNQMMELIAKIRDQMKK